jgi:hypothetical protein
MKQYFTLLGMQCKKSLKEKLDGTFYPVTNPTPERYASIVPNYRGDCPLHMENGYCMLQAHLGEAALPAICRYYPRIPRTTYAPECSCSNSCEKVLELLFEQDKMTFETKELEFKMPKQESLERAEDRLFYLKIRSFCFDILENRTFSLTTRILMVGKVLQEIDKDRNIDLSTLDLSVPSFEKNVRLTFDVVINLSRWFIENSRSISEFCQDNEDYYTHGDFMANYIAALEHFQEVLPNHEILFEKLLINNLFSRQFPFQDPSETFSDEFVSVCGIYLFMHYLAVGYMRNKNKMEDFIDIMSRTFRVLDHTRFEHNILTMLKNENATDFETLATLLQA